MSNQIQKKTLQDLDLLDRFLFARVIEDTDTYTDILDILLGEDIKLLTQSQTEKEFRTTPLLRSIRVDVFSMDDRRTIYTTDPQKQNTHNLPKRSRYYSSLIDSSLMSPGTTDFNELNDIVLIMIMPFDLFGYEKYRYSFQMECKEVPGLKLKDGTTRIFFNTRGANRDEVSSDLVELLEYMENTSKKSNYQSDNAKIRRIQKQVELIKSSEEMGVRYMQEWEEKAMLLQEAEKCNNALIKMLLEQNRQEDLMHATEDETFKQKLFEELGITMEY